MTFEDFIKSKGIEVVQGRILIKDARKVRDLEYDYELQTAKEGGLPEKLKPNAQLVISVEFREMERCDQKPEKYGCKLIKATNHDDEDTWNGVIEGTVNSKRTTHA